MIERQSRNLEWAIIDKGPFQLHPSPNHFILPAEVWLSMSVNDKESYIKKVMSSSVTDTVALACSPTEEMAECVSTDPSREECLLTKNVAFHLLMFWQMLHYLLQSKILRDHVCQICPCRFLNSVSTFMGSPKKP